MSTERKPGSRGVTTTFSRDRANPESRFNTEPGAREQATPKGRTKTVSPRKGFKKRPRK